MGVARLPVELLPVRFILHAVVGLGLGMIVWGLTFMITNLITGTGDTSMAMCFMANTNGLVMGHYFWGGERDDTTG